ncbi:MAG: hypothetical protein R2685_10055 [Candidatus Nitrosocosmicus sp.]|nr:hypothetical protein [Candidatus Nitrosocosmicus sp.]
MSSLFIPSGFRVAYSSDVNSNKISNQVELGDNNTDKDKNASNTSSSSSPSSSPSSPSSPSSSTPSAISTPEENEGILIVKVITDNGESGTNQSSDFVVNIHANNPIPATFKGSDSGTLVKLSMGMYSVTTSSIPNYNTSLSSDCAGGIMKVEETAHCDIVNTYIHKLAR